MISRNNARKGPADRSNAVVEHHCSADENQSCIASRAVAVGASDRSDNRAFRCFELRTSSPGEEMARRDRKTAFTIRH